MKEYERFMRILIFFDLPIETVDNRRQYRKFRKFLTSNGFLMLQKSVYSKLVMNYGSCNLEIEKIKRNKPKDGLVQCLTVTEKQFADIINITGEITSSFISSTERLVEL